jgi:CheY-like chemotaxis protein
VLLSLGGLALARVVPSGALPLLLYGLSINAAQSEELATARERNRIAREIHDGLGHYLTTVHMQIQAARSILAADRARAEDTLAKAQQLAHEALGDVRRSVSALRATPAERPPLPAALAELADSAQLMDLRMPLLDGVAATRRLRAEHPEIQVIALTTFDDDADVFAALRAGAIGYLLKDVSGDTLLCLHRGRVTSHQVVTSDRDL